MRLINMNEHQLWHLTDSNMVKVFEHILSTHGHVYCVNTRKNRRRPDHLAALTIASAWKPLRFQARDRMPNPRLHTTRGMFTGTTVFGVFTCMMLVTILSVIVEWPCGSRVFQYKI